MKSFQVVLASCALAACAAPAPATVAPPDRLDDRFYPRYQDDLDARPLTAGAAAFILRNLTGADHVPDDLLAAQVDRRMLGTNDRDDREMDLDKTRGEVARLLSIYRPDQLYYIDLPYEAGDYSPRNRKAPISIAGFCPGTHVAGRYGPDGSFAIRYQFQNCADPEFSAIQVEDLQQGKALPNRLVPIYRDSPTIARIFVKILTTRNTVDPRWIAADRGTKAYTLKFYEPELRLFVTRVDLADQNREFFSYAAASEQPRT